jgi:hypothetical protein
VILPPLVFPGSASQMNIFENDKQMLEYQNLLLLREIWCQGFNLKLNAFYLFDNGGGLR